MKTNFHKLKEDIDDSIGAPIMIIEEDCTRISSKLRKSIKNGDIVLYGHLSESLLTDLRYAELALDDVMDSIHCIKTQILRAVLWKKMS